MMLQYTSQTTDISWHAQLWAARLVEKTGTAQLPARIGEINFQEIADPARFGLPTLHPLQKRYPTLRVANYFMIVQDRYLVERDGVRGVALFTESNGSGLCASITSENGRNPLAPWDWEGQPGTLTDASAQPFLDWRSIEVGGNAYPWFSAAIHGWPGWAGEHRGLDWRDGIPESITTMYKKGTGRVGQSVMVPYEAPGLGAAEQTVSAGQLQKTYSVLLFFPVAEAARLARYLGHIDQYRDEYVGLYKGGVRFRGGPTLGGSRSYGEVLGAGEPEPEALRGGERRVPVQPDYKMAVGGWIKQHVIPNPFSSFFWNPVPEVLLICWPISEARASRLLSPTLEDRRQTF